MADAAKEILTRWGLDTSSWSGTVNSAKQLINSASSDDAKRSAASQKATAAAIDGLTKQLALVKEISSVATAPSSSPSAKSKTDEIRNQAALQAQAARAALDAAKLQTAAENAKAAAARAAMAEQKAAAQAAIQQSQQNMAEQRRITKEASDAARAALNDVKRGPQREFSNIPIARPDNRNQPLEERDAPRVDQRARTQSPLAATTGSITSAVTDATQVEAAAASSETLATTQTASASAADVAAASYKAEAVALIELKTAQANLSETFAAIAAGQLSESAASKYLAADLRSVADAQAQVNNVRSNRAAQTTQVAANADTELQALNARNARIDAAQEAERAKQLASLRADIEKRNALEAQYSSRSMSLAGYNDPFDPAPEESEHSAHGGGAGSSEYAGLGLSRGRRYRDTIDAGMGRTTSGAIEAGIAAVPGLATLTEAAFPVAAAGALLDMVKNLATGVVDYAVKLKNLPDTIRQAFGQQNLDLEQSTDEIKKATDATEAAIARMDRKPADTVKMAFDEQRLAADELASAANRASESLGKLLDGSQFGNGDAIFAKLHNLLLAIPGAKQLTSALGGDASEMSSDTTTALRTYMVQQQRKIQDAANLYQQSMHSPGFSPEQQAAYKKDYEDQQNALKTHLEGLNKQYNSFTESRFGNAPEVVSSDYAQTQLAQNPSRRDIKTPQQNAAEHANNLAVIGSALRGVYDQQDQESAKAKELIAQQTLEAKQAAQEQAQWALQTAEATYASLKKLSEDRLAQTQTELAAETQADEARYKSGVDNARTYYAEKDALAKRSLDAELANIAEGRKDDLAILARRAPVEHMSGEAYRANVTSINSEYDTRAQQAQRAYRSATAQDSSGLREAQNQAAVALINEQLDAQKRAIETQTDMVKSSYRDQTVSANDYLHTSLSLIQQQVDAVSSAEEAKRALGLQTSQQIESIKSQIDATSSALKAVKDLQQSWVQDTSNSIKSNFDQVSGAIGDAATLNSSSGPDLTTQAQLSGATQQKQLLDAQLQAQEALLSQADQYSTTWFNIYDNILKSTQQAQELTDKIATLSSYNPQVGGMFTALGQTGSTIFGGRYAQGFERSLSAAGGVFGDSQKYANQIFGVKPSAESQDPAIKALQDSANQGAQQLQSSTKDSTTSLNTFSDGLKTAISSLQSFAAGLQAQLSSLMSRDLGSATQSVSSATTAANGIPISNASVQNGLVQSGSISEALNAGAIQKASASVANSNYVPPSSVAAPTFNADVTAPAETQLPLENTSVTGLIAQAPIQPFQASSGMGNLDPLTSGLQQFSQQITGAAKAVGGFASSIASAGSASAGGVAGGISGAGLGGSITSAAASSSNSTISSIGGALGPFGSLIGGAIGSALGAVMGQKQEEVEDDINQLQASYKGIMNSYSSNNASLQATVQSLQALIAQAQADEASTKKGGSQFVSLIQQYNEQIQALQDQQAQTMASMTQQLITLGEANPYQAMLGNIQSILQQYEQFAGAAQNAQQLAQANQFLTESLQQLGAQYTQQLQQDEVSAIQNALQLNQLLNQRNQMQQQYIQQVESIAGQGTLTRGITQSQSKYSQLYGLDVNYQNQLQTINEQISAAQYQVQAQQQIFNLATTQQGLQTQLLAAQEQGIALDMSRIVAMQNLLGTLQKTGYSITNLSNVSSSDPNATTTLLLQLLTGMLNSSGGSTLLNSLLTSGLNNNVAVGVGGLATI